MKKKNFSSLRKTAKKSTANKMNEGKLNNVR